jgi:alpha-tubulin suppressor-like RCC1 family protein
MKKIFYLISITALFFVKGANEISAQSIDAGWAYSLFLCNDNTVRACGYNFYGQLGDSTFDTIPPYGKNIPVTVNSLSEITAVSGGYFHSIFLKNDGTVWTCGNNLYGQLGIGTNTDTNISVQVISLNEIIAVSAGANHSLFLKNDGTVMACGWNSFGQLGDGTDTNRHTPVPISSLSGIITVSGGGSHSLFLKNDGTVWACGWNGDGRLGDGTWTDSNVPVYVNSLSGVTSVSAGGYHSLFLKNDGTVWACGDNNNGELGNGTFDTIPPYGINTPAQVNFLSGVIAVSAGWNHSLFLKK